MEGIAAIDLLVQPGAWIYAIGIGGVLLAVIGLVRLEEIQLLAVGIRTLPTRRGITGRFLLGNLAAVPLGILLVLIASTTAATDTTRLALLGIALLLYLYLGLVLPRRPLVEAQKERRQLRKLTPGFVAYARVALAGYDSPAVLLERFVERPNRRKAAMQRACRDALTLMHREHVRPFAALLQVARARGCQELIDVAESLARSEDEGTDPQTVLLAQEGMLNQILEDEFKQVLEKKKVVLLILAAISLIIGVLVNLLYVMVVGSGALGAF